MSVWVDNEQFPVPIFVVFNGAVTAWHITDWLWQSSAENRNKLAKRYKFAFTEGTPSGIGRGLERFQEAVAKDSRHLFICREIANGSKHIGDDGLYLGLAEIPPSLARVDRRYSEVICADVFALP